MSPPVAAAHGATRDYYAVLGLQPDCDIAEVERAYVRMAIDTPALVDSDNHDQHHGDDAQPPTLVDLADAFEALSDPELRSIYDASRRYNNTRQLQYM